MIYMENLPLFYVFSSFRNHKQLHPAMFACLSSFHPYIHKCLFKFINKKYIEQRLQENDCQEMIQMWNSILQEGETSSLVENLIRRGKGKMGRMKIVRAKSMKTADQFYFTLRLTRSVSSLEECFEVIRDYGGIQIEKQLMKFEKKPLLLK